MENIEKILEMADAEFGAMVKNGKFKSREEIDSVYKLMDIVKDGLCVLDMEEGGYEDDMSYDGSYRGSYNRGSMRGSYNDGDSYARGRRGNVKRDSMGRYSREGSYRGGSYRGGYSRDDGKEEYIEHLHELLETAPDENTRQSIHRMIQEAEKA